MAKKPKKDCVVSFRMTEDQYALHEQIIKDSDIKPSQYFRELMLNKKPIFKAATKDHERMLFLMNKASNNLNQLAHQVNTAHRRGIISEKIYIQWLNNLACVRDLMQIGINHVDSG